MLCRTIKRSFNLLKSLSQVKDAIRAPIKHIKAFMEPTGAYLSTQPNTTEQAFDQVSGQWQAFVGNNPFDMQIYNYFQSVQLANFGTVDNPLVIFTADVPFRYVGCSGPQTQQQYQSHQLFWIMLRQGPLQRCCVCGQVFKLVRLRNQFSSQMDYYMFSFNKLWFEELRQQDFLNVCSITKANTHYQPTLIEQPQDTVYSFITGDDHDRILTDPAYRIQRQTQGQLKARIYLLAMEDYENAKLRSSPIRHPISKVVYENLMESQALIKKMDRNFRKVLKFQSRKYVDPVNHPRREARMLQRAKKRWDGSYTLYTGFLTQEEQRYKDYFQTDLQQNKQDQKLQQFLDKQELLTDQKYSLRHYDFQQGYTIAPEDDQTSYVEKKAFKFKYRRALDKPEQYDRRNKRMIQGQKQRFIKNNVQQLIQNYIREPAKYEQQYLSLVKQQAIAQYHDYFQSQKDQIQQQILSQNKIPFSSIFENWQLPLQDNATFQTFPLPKWNNQLGFWSNATSLITELSKSWQSTKQIQKNYTLQAISQSSLVQHSDKSKGKIQDQKTNQQLK